MKEKEITKDRFEEMFGTASIIIWGETPSAPAGPDLPWEEEGVQIFLVGDASGVVFWPSCGHIYPFHVR